MKKLIVFMIMIVSLFMTACDNEEKAKETTTTTTSVEEMIENTAPNMFVYEGVLHTHLAENLYRGEENLYDEATILDGYTSIGETVGKVKNSQTPVGEMYSNFLKEGTTIYYNKEKDVYAFVITSDTNSTILVGSHTCNEDCIKTAD